MSWGVRGFLDGWVSNHVGATEVPEALNIRDEEDELELLALSVGEIAVTEVRLHTLESISVHWKTNVCWPKGSSHASISYGPVGSYPTPPSSHRLAAPIVTSGSQVSAGARGSGTFRRCCSCCSD